MKKKVKNLTKKSAKNYKNSNIIYIFAVNKIL